MDLRVNGVRTGTIGSGAARGIVYTRCVRILVRRVIKMCEVASEGLLSEVCAKGRLGGVCEVSWNRSRVSNGYSDRSSAMGRRKTAGTCSTIRGCTDDWKMENAVRGRFAKKTGTGGLTEYEDSNETDGGVPHGTET
jgi:hypothetical protein